MLEDISLNKEEDYFLKWLSDYNKDITSVLPFSHKNLSSSLYDIEFSLIKKGLIELNERSLWELTELGKEIVE